MRDVAVIGQIGTRRLPKKCVVQGQRQTRQMPIVVGLVGASACNGMGSISTGYASLDPSSVSSEGRRAAGPQL